MTPLEHINLIIEQDFGRPPREDTLDALLDILEAAYEEGWDAACATTDGELGLGFNFFLDNHLEEGP